MLNNKSAGSILTIYKEADTMSPLIRGRRGISPVKKPIRNEAQDHFDFDFDLLRLSGMGKEGKTLLLK